MLSPHLIRAAKINRLISWLSDIKLLTVLAITVGIVTICHPCLHSYSKGYRKTWHDIFSIGIVLPIYLAFYIYWMFTYLSFVCAWIRPLLCCAKWRRAEAITEVKPGSVEAGGEGVKKPLAFPACSFPHYTHLSPHAASASLQRQKQPLWSCNLHKKGL